MRKDYLDLPMIERYLRFDYGPILTSDDVWLVAQLDQEYGKFRNQFTKISEFL